MTKSDFTQSAIHLPGFPLLEDKRAEQLKFSSAPKLISHEDAMLLGKDMIANGVPPVRAWRQAFGKSLEDVSREVEINPKRYALLENVSNKLTEEDAFCLSIYYGIMPYHLQENSANVMPKSLLRATLRVYNLPDQYVPMKEEAHMALTDEALPSRSIEILQAKARNFKGQRLYGLTAGLIESLIFNDRLTYNENINLVDDFLMYAYCEEEDLKNNSDALVKRREEVIKKYNTWGHKLYNALGDDEITWPAVSNGLNMLMRTMDGNKLLNYYATKPQSIGLDQWPKVQGDFIDENYKFYGSWKSAHAQHVKYLTQYFKIDRDNHDAKARLKHYSSQIEVMVRWTEGNSGLIERYDNRQEITAHPDFKHLKTAPKRPQLKLPKL